MICLTCLSLPHFLIGPRNPNGRMEFVSFRFHNDILSNGKPSVKVRGLMAVVTAGFATPP